MALSRLPKKSGATSTPGRKPFLSDYMEDHPDHLGYNFEIELVKETNSRSGYLLETKAFNCCLFKSSEQCEELLELIEAVYSQHHCGIFVIIDESEPSGFALAYDTEVKRTWVRTKKFPGGYRYVHAQTGARSRKLPRNLSGTDSQPG
jgi:hypothetical protein